MLFSKIIAELKESPTCSVPLAGAALANMTRNTAYEAAKNGTLGVPTFWAGGKLRVPSIAVLQRLGLVEAAAEDASQQATEAPALPAARERPAQRRKTPAKLQPKSPLGPKSRTSANRKGLNRDPSAALAAAE